MNGNQKAIELFLDSKIGISPATRYHYKARLDIFTAWLDKKKISIEKFNQDNLIAFLTHETKSYKPKSMNHLKAVMVAFIKFNYSKDFYSRFPNLANICKSQKVMPTYSASQMLSVEEVQKLIQRENNPFWKTIFAMQFYGGCRPCEIRFLKWKDVTIAEDGVYFKIYSAKNNQNFEKFVPIEFSNYIKELQNNSKGEYVFSKNNNQPIGKSVYNKHLSRLGKKVFPDKSITPYLLRHSAATILYGKADKGEISDDVAARQMGHSVSMKKVYAHFDIQTLRERAKSIYIKPDYSPEKKITLEAEMAKIKKDNEDFQKNILAQVQNIVERTGYSVELTHPEVNKFIEKNGKKYVLMKSSTTK